MRRYDLHLRIIDPNEQQQTETFTFGKKALLVDGFQKLANRFVKIFFTPKGSNPLRINEGTEFAYLLGSNVSDVASLQATIGEYVDDAVNQIKSVDARSPLLATNERLRDAQLIQFNVVDATHIEFWIELTNQAGERLKILLPYETSDG